VATFVFILLVVVYMVSDSALIDITHLAHFPISFFPENFVFF